MGKAFKAGQSLTFGFWFRELTLGTGCLIDFLNGTFNSKTGGGLKVCRSDAAEFTATYAAHGGTQYRYGLSVVKHARDAQWHHFMLRFDPQEVVIVIDHKKVQSLFTSTATSLFSGYQLNDIAIGKGLQIELDEIKVYDRLLTDPQECQLVIGGSWVGGACKLP